MASRKDINSVEGKQELLFVEIKKGEFRGYKQGLLVKKLDEVEVEFYVCTKCNGLMRNACEIGSEQTPVCGICAGQTKPHPMVKSRKKILELRVKCPLEGRGCEWNGTIGEMDAHLDVCTEFIVNCTNKCDVIMKRSDLINHCKNECQNRNVNCQHCNTIIIFKEIVTHNKICPKFPLLCTNECLKNLLRKELDLHIKIDCPNTIINCSYLKMGCEAMMKRREVEEHEKIFELKHMKIMVNKIEEMDEFLKTDKLKAENKRLTQNCLILEKSLSEMDCKVKELSEKISYPVVLGDKIGKGFIDSILARKAEYSGDYIHKYPTSYDQIYSNPNRKKKEEVLTNEFSFRWNQHTFSIIFKYVKDKNIIITTIRLETKSESSFQKNIRAKFKMTITDTMNIMNSLIFWSKEESLNTYTSLHKYYLGMLNERNEFTLAEIPKGVILEERLRNRDGSISFMLQMQELNDLLV